LKKAFPITIKEIKGTIDVRNIFKKLYKEEAKGSLGHISEKILKKPLSKLD
jgi:hypothetical protein